MYQMVAQVVVWLVVVVLMQGLPWTRQGDHRHQAGCNSRRAAHDLAAGDSGLVGIVIMEEAGDTTVAVVHNLELGVGRLLFSTRQGATTWLMCRGRVNA